MPQPNSKRPRPRSEGHMPGLAERMESRVMLSTYAVTNTNDSGPGSLRDAVQQANANPGADTISYGAGLGPVTLTSGSLEFRDTSGPTTIDGADIFLGSASRAIIVDAGVTAIFSDLGVGSPSPGTFNGGALLNNGNVSITGGGFGSMNVSGDGGAVYNNGTLLITDFRFDSNQSARGGAVFNNGGTAVMSGCTFGNDPAAQAGDTATSGGGGLYVAGGTATLRDNTTMLGEHAKNGAGDMVLVAGGDLIIDQSTIYEQSGQAIDVTGGSVTMTNVTTSALSIAPNTSGDVTLYNTIVGFLQGTLDAHPAADQVPSSFNLIGPGGSGGLTDGVNGNHVSVNTLVTGLAYFGGPTQTAVPMLGSPAIDGGSNALAMDADGQLPTTDQRGFARIYNGTIDIGSVEYQPLLVNTTVNGGVPFVRGLLTLDSAWRLAAAGAAPPGIGFDPAVFVPGVPHTITGGVMQLGLARSISIVGPGPGLLTLKSPLFSIGPGTVSLSGMEITGNSASIGNSGTLSLTNVRVDAISSSGSSVGPIVNLSGGTLTASDCTFQGNTASSEGGAVYNVATASLIDCAFIGNSAARRGGAISNYGQLTLVGCTFAGNTANSGFGGAIANSASAVLPPELSISDSTIISNSAAGAGGILSTFNNNAVMNNTIVAQNTRPDHATADDLSGRFAGSYDLIGTASGSAGLVNGTNGNIVGVADPKLGPLGNYDGATETIPLLPGSPALDAGSNALAVDSSGNPLTADQRGLPRIFNGAVDIGAYEAQPPTVAGDVNHDGTTNFSDLLLLAQHYGSAAQPLWEGGDLTGDGSVAFADLLLLAQNYGKSATAAAAGSLNDVVDLTATVKTRHRR